LRLTDFGADQANPFAHKVLRRPFNSSGTPPKTTILGISLSLKYAAVIGVQEESVAVLFSGESALLSVKKELTPMFV